MAVGAELIRLEVEGEGNVKAGASVAAAVAAPAAKPEALAVRSAQASPPSTPPSAREGAPEPLQPPRTTPAPMRAPGEKPIASPAVRRRAWDLGIELQFVHGSGPAGRIVHEDLDVYLATRGQPAAAAPGLRQRHGEQAIPVIGLRRKIAQKMQEAKRRIPHFSYVEEIDVTELEALRAQLNEKYAASRGKLTSGEYGGQEVEIDEPFTTTRITVGVTWRPRG
jgi:2-oxoisovalerate dehydrogenase E2 component (dihydrolipoyl transacylase)